MEETERNDANIIGWYIGFGWHNPHKPSYKGGAVTIIRDPIGRLVSAFFFKQPCGPRSWGMSKKPMDWCLQKDSGGSSAANNTTKRMHLHLAGPGIRHCQTKMAMGSPCGSD
jgi:hypothetical protein